MYGSKSQFRKNYFESYLRYEPMGYSIPLRANSGKVHNILKPKAGSLLTVKPIITFTLLQCQLKICTTVTSEQHGSVIGLPKCPHILYFGILL